MPNNQTFRRARRGSALLLALLMLVAVTSFTLFILKVTLIASHSANSADEISKSVQMAQIGLQEGMRVKDSSAEGVTYRRGYNNANCDILTTLAAAASNTTARKDCPYYDITVRKTVTAAYNYPAVFTNRDIPFVSTFEKDAGNKIITNPLSIGMRTGAIFDITVRMTSLNDYGNCTESNVVDPSGPSALCKIVISSDAGGSTYTMSPTISSTRTFESYGGVTYYNSNYRYIASCTGSPCLPTKVNFNLLFRDKVVNFPDTKVIVTPYQGSGGGTSTSSANDTLTVYKGYTTIESTGYYGNAKKRLIMYVRDKDYSLATPGKSAEVYDFSRVFDSTTGCIKDISIGSPANFPGARQAACPNYVKDSNTGKYTEILQ